MQDRIAQLRAGARKRAPPRRHLVEHDSGRPQVGAHVQSAADKLLAVGDLKSPTAQDSVEAAAWTSVARVLFNLHETITRN